MRANRTEYLFSVNTHTPPTMTGIELIPFGTGKSAILRHFSVLRREFPEPIALSSPVRDGRAWFGGRIPLPLDPNLGTISTMPPEGYKPSYAGAYAGDFDQKDAGQGSRIYLPDMSEADELYEMVNIYPADSGLPMTVWAGPPLAAAHE